jgi:hypothetical protein
MPWPSGTDSIKCKVAYSEGITIGNTIIDTNSRNILAGFPRTHVQYCLMAHRQLTFDIKYRKIYMTFNNIYIRIR